MPIFMPELDAIQPNAQQGEYKADVSLPERLKDYGVPVYLDHGSTGTVFKLVQPLRHVLKVIPCGKSERLLEATLYEIRVMRRLCGCAKAVQLVDSEVVAEDGRSKVYLVEEYAKPFLDVMCERDFTATECVGIAIGIAEALMACKEAGVLHLDVQPKNLYFSDKGHVLLGDFSSALFVEDKDDQSRLRGTRAFMAPEVFRDRRYSERSDIYSVGILLYCLLSNGAYPFVYLDRITEAVYRRLAGERLPLIANLDKVAGTVVDEALAHVCAFDPLGRPQSFEELRDYLVNLQRLLFALNADDAQSSSASTAKGANADWLTDDSRALGTALGWDKYEIWGPDTLVPDDSLY